MPPTHREPPGAERLRRVGLLLLAAAGSVVLAFGALGGLGGAFGELGADAAASWQSGFLASPAGALMLMLAGAAVVIAALMTLHFLPRAPRVAGQLPLPSAARALEWLLLAGSLSVTAWSFGAWYYGAGPQPQGDQYAVLGALGAINAWRSLQSLLNRPRD